jgi:hypothetical protein
MRLRRLLTLQTLWLLLWSQQLLRLSLLWWRLLRLSMQMWRYSLPPWRCLPLRLGLRLRLWLLFVRLRRFRRLQRSRPAPAALDHESMSGLVGIAH